MVLDEVAEGLRTYRKVKDGEKGWLLLGKLARTKDPRVAVVLGDLLTGPDEEVSFKAAVLMRQNFPVEITAGLYRSMALYWWEANEADLRRRAAQLPR
jgi:hypothetical protein